MMNSDVESLRHFSPMLGVSFTNEELFLVIRFFEGGEVGEIGRQEIETGCERHSNWRIIRKDSMLPPMLGLRLLGAYLSLGSIGNHEVIYMFEFNLNMTHTILWIC